MFNCPNDNEQLYIDPDDSDKKTCLLCGFSFIIIPPQRIVNVELQEHYTLLEELEGKVR